MVPHKEEEELTDESYVIEPSNRRRRPSVVSLSSEFSTNQNVDDVSVNLVASSVASFASTPTLATSFTESVLDKVEE